MEQECGEKDSVGCARVVLLMRWLMMEIKNERVGRECWREEEGREREACGGLQKDSRGHCRRRLLVGRCCWVVVIGWAGSGKVERWWMGGCGACWGMG